MGYSCTYNQKKRETPQKIYFWGVCEYNNGDLRGKFEVDRRKKGRKRGGGVVMMVVVKETFLEEGRENVGAWEWDGGKGVGVGWGWL